MLTPQEVSSHAFPKAVMGGYHMGAVDEFLDELTDDYTALYKENTALKAKMKVLVEKVEDYRATEDSMRATLLTAQKMADSIVKEAEAKRETLMAQAETDARARIGQLRAELAEAETRLKAGQAELAKFATEYRTKLEQELVYLDQLPRMPVETPAEDPAEAQPQVGEIEEKIFAAFSPAPLQETEPAPQAVPPQETQKTEDVPQAPVREVKAERESGERTPERYPAGDPFAPDEDVDEPTRVIRLDQLKFGRNYSGALDEDDT